MHIAAACALLVAGTACWGSRPSTSETLRVEDWRAPTPSACEIAARSSEQGLTPIVDGAIQVESVRGERRLWLEDADRPEWSNDGKHIAVGGLGTVSIWNAQDGHFEKVIRVPGVAFEIAQVRWSTDDKSLQLDDQQRGLFATTAVVSVNGDDRGTLRFRWTPNGERETFGALVVARWGSTTAELAAPKVRDENQPLRYQSSALLLRNGDACVQVGTVYPADIVSFSRDGSSLLVSQRDYDGDMLVSQRDARDGRLLNAARTKGDANQALLQPDLDRVMFFVPGGVSIYGWSHKNLIAAVDARQVSYTPQGRADLFNTPNFDRPGGESGVVFASRNGKFLLGESQAFTQHISIWNLHDMSTSRFIPIGRSIERIAVSADETRFAIGATDGMVEVRRVSDGALEFQLERSSAITALAFSPDGKLIASGGRDGVVQIASTDSGTVRGRLKLEADRASLMTWSGPSRLVIDSKYGQTITIDVQ